MTVVHTDHWKWKYCIATTLMLLNRLCLLCSDLIQRVHLRGSFQVTRAAWNHMKKQKFGRWGARRPCYISTEVAKCASSSRVQEFRDCRFKRSSTICEMVFTSAAACRCAAFGFNTFRRCSPSLKTACVAPNVCPSKWRCDWKSLTSVVSWHSSAALSADDK